MNILIVKTSSLGDIVQAMSVLPALRAWFPEARIDWVIEEPFADLLLRHPLIDHVLKVNTKRWRKALAERVTWREISHFAKRLRYIHYDVLFDLQGNTKSALVNLLARAKHKVGWGRATVSEWPNLLTTYHHYNPPLGQNIRQDYLNLIHRYFFQEEAMTTPQQGILLKMQEDEKAIVERLITHPKLQRFTPKVGALVVVCPGSAWRNKQVTLDALLSFLNQTYHEFNMRFIWIWGNEEEHLVAQKLYERFATASLIAPRMSLPALQNLMAHADLIIAMDSLPLHLGGTTSTPTFSLFGASLAAKYKPLGDQHLALQGSCPYKKSFKKRCPRLRTCSTGLCIRGLTGDQIMQAFQPWWQRVSEKNN